MQLTLYRVTRLISTDSTHSIPFVCGCRASLARKDGIAAYDRNGNHRPDNMTACILGLYPPECAWGSADLCITMLAQFNIRFSWFNGEADKSTTQAQTQRTAGHSGGAKLFPT